MTPRQAFAAFEVIEHRFSGAHSPLYRVLEALILQGEGLIERLEQLDGEGPQASVRILLERSLEAHGVNLDDPILSGLAALEQDLWALRCSVIDTLTEKRVAEQLDRLAQRTGLLLTLAGGTR